MLYHPVLFLHHLIQRLIEPGQYFSSPKVKIVIILKHDVARLTMSSRTRTQLSISFALPAAHLARLYGEESDSAMKDVNVKKILR